MAENIRFRFTDSYMSAISSVAILTSKDSKISILKDTKISILNGLEDDDTLKNWYFLPAILENSCHFGK